MLPMRQSSDDQTAAAAAADASDTEDWNAPSRTTSSSMPIHQDSDNPLLLTGAGSSPSPATTVSLTACHPDVEQRSATAGTFSRRDAPRPGRHSGRGYRNSTATSSSSSSGSAGPFDFSPGCGSGLNPDEAFGAVCSDSRSGLDEMTDTTGGGGGHMFQPAAAGSSTPTMAMSSSGPCRSTSHDECVVCGDRASGFHYNAFSCEGCKGFFRRSILRRAVYTCKYGDNCEMDVWMRRRCQSCRLRRCLEVGMRQECLLSETQCRARESRRKTKHRQHSTPPTGPSSSGSVSRPAAADDQPPISPLEQININHRELIENLVKYQEIYELPNESDIVALDVKLNEDDFPKDVPTALFQHMVNMTVLVTHLVVEFAKKMPGFLELEKDDQIVLLKGSASEVMVLRTARRYNPVVDQVIFGDGTPVTKESLCLGGLLQDYVDDMFIFARRMSTLAVDNAEYALLTAICIFSDRPDLTDVAKVDACRERYIDALIAYEQHRRSGNANFLAKLLHKLVDLRTLNSSHASALRVLRVERGSLPQLLSEYFDVFD